MVAVVIAANFEPCFCGCARAEYQINGECCPMCAPGNRVYWHCTVDTSTTCVPCPASTFTDEPNGLTNCFPCTVCATVKGLKTHKSCIRSGDTLCEPQEGFYCFKQNKGSCELAMEHSKCQPGQYIKHTGTALSDTVCVDCINGTYSNGSVMSCLPHSKCEMLGLKEKKAGTTSSDAECEKVTSVVIIVIVTITVVVAVIVAVLLVYIKYRKRKAQDSKNGVHYISQPTEDDETAHSTSMNQQ